MPEGYISGVDIVTRYGCCADRVRDIEVRAGVDPVPNGFKGRLTINTKVATFVGPADANLKTYRINFDRSVLAKYVTLQRIGGHVTLEINEVTMIKGGTSSSDCKCGLAKRKSRIVGGVVTEVNEYPWQVGIVNKGHTQVWCGASLISDKWILTAAHCTRTKSAGNIQALLGEHDYSSNKETSMVRVGIAEIINHPDYHHQTTNIDFSLLKMKKTIDFSKYSHIRPICLPTDTSKDYTDFTATVSGWGTLSSGGSSSKKLREVDVKVLSNSDCKNKYSYPSSWITSQMLCANVDGGGKDACQGDSGGPLVTAGSGNGVTAGQNYELIGVVSWGSGCASASYPGVYSRVTMQLDWITATTGAGWNTCPRE